MKYCLLILVIFLTGFAFAQQDNPDNLRAKLFELKIKSIPPDNWKLPFESIQIIDGRADTSKLGFINNNPFETYMFQKIILKKGIAKEIENFYNGYYKNNFTSNGKILLISIKKLWIDNIPDGHGKFKKRDLEKLSLQNIYAKFEYYSGSVNEYMPLTRMDTVFQLTPMIKVDDYDASNEKRLPFFCFVLEKMVENINYENLITEPQSKKKMNLEEIIKYNDKAGKIPVLMEAIKPGVFMTFDEFKNNQPSVINFSKRKIPNRKIYEIIDEKERVILKYFAYYDGEKIVKSKSLSSLGPQKQSQYNFGIYRIGNSFQFFENHILNNTYSSRINIPDKNISIPITIPGSNIITIPRQIDLETGEIY